MAFHLAVYVTGLVLLLASPLTGQSQEIPFGYSGVKGPDKWGSLNPHYSTCSAGKQQSPVNIANDDVVSNSKLGSLDMDYNSANATLINNGFNIGMLFGNDIGELIADEEIYYLKQMHWHTPSEHTINGIRYPVELHLVHVADDGKVLMVAILYQYGNPDPLIEEIKSYLDQLAKEKCSADEEIHIPVESVKSNNIERDTSKYYRYIGSLTIPPCTEDVTWYILGKVVEISKGQIDAMKALMDSEYKNNARPIQPLNGRKIELYEDGH
ncbi:PREDICTED: alpha carbonic anhydrase 1, chloroplastic-like [Nelumbo nucifera]|uniref:Carbonic anhydrase n=2 Tax=Nelumbo nucifera TaxID=4432 RepID=A0A1U8B6A4_NELNU|nr:PREDICTED: alpha carbonic anhydrase 1, chloroplastic-like [Nelumbo nucifera]DAD28841.1 TPA_asm: hypothetical protein HUJ06_030309 [Nelumbo nucifera]